VALSKKNDGGHPLKIEKKEISPNNYTPPPFETYLISIILSGIF